LQRILKNEEKMYHYLSTIRTSLFLFTIGSMLMLPSLAQTVVKDYEPGVSKDGVVYFLPKTALNITLTSVKETYTPGELCQYADRYMRLTDISDKEETHFELLSAHVDYKAMADETKRYHITFNTNSLAPQVTLSDEGTLLSICGGDLLAMASTEIVAPTTEALWEVKDAREYMTEEMLMATSKAKLAELVAREIYDIRESRNSLMRGESDYMPADGEGLKLMVDNLQKQEDALLKLFTGTTSREIKSTSYEVVPETNMTKYVVARFSRKMGVLEADNLAGSPVYLDVKSLSGSPSTTQEVQPDSTLTESKKGGFLKSSSKKSKSYDGVVYNLPAKSNVRLYTAGDVLVDETTFIPQFGTTETLSSKLFTKKATTKVQLNPITGALLRIEE